MGNAYEAYDFTEASFNELIFEFISIGPQGVIKKVVEFQRTSDRYVYNLAFGDRSENGDIDDLAISNNNDRDKILATVVSIIILFTTRHPDSFIFFSGSTQSRIRLYRMAISINFLELAKIFEIWGLHETEGLIKFNSSDPYKGFLIKRK